MWQRKPLCQRYEQGETMFGNDISGPGGYLAAVSTSTLPAPERSDRREIRIGYAAGVSGSAFSRWLFFEAVEPAVAFGRAARMSMDCSAYGVYPAARELMFCDRHEEDERVLLIIQENVDRRDGEVALLKRFVQSVKENPWSAYWSEPTGFVTRLVRGLPVKTGKGSLPL